jgi:YidC/Oxa1 family membrane protein insertase
MEKRFVAAFALSVLIVLGWSILSRKMFPPAPAPPGGGIPAAVAPPVSPGGAPPASPLPPADAPSVAGTPPADAAPATSAREEEIRLETDHASVVLTNRGGRVTSWKLKDFKAAGREVDFVTDAARNAGFGPLSLVFDDRAILPGINDALFTATRTDEPDGSTRVVFQWADGAGSEVRKTLVFRKSIPLVNLEVSSVDRGRAVTPRIWWGPGLEVEHPEHRSNTYYWNQALIYDGRQVTRLARRKLESVVAIPESTNLEWAGLEDQYFTALVLPEGARGSVTLTPLAQSTVVPVGKNVPAPLAEAPTIAVGLPGGKATLFVGAKEFGPLKALGHGLEHAVWFSSYSLIYACAKPVFLALRWVHDHWIANYGSAIIVLTIGLRLLLFPLNQYSMVKMRTVAGDMQRVQPKLKAIQAKYKKSKDPEARAKMNAETMELYKREGVNPFGGVSGCLPLLIQMPILWAFFDVLTATVELRGAPFFGWIHDLSHPDPFWITPILMGATMFAQQKMTPTGNVDPAQQKIMMFMPLMFTVMFGSLPSGLVLYYFVNNLLGIGQQWLVNRQIARIETSAARA